MTPKQAAKLLALRARISAGLPVKESEWPAWQRAAGRLERYTDDRNEYDFRADYLQAIGKTADQANPCAIYWDAYWERERGLRDCRGNQIAG